MKVTKLMRRATSLFLVLVMLFSFPVGAYSEGTGSDPEEAPEIPEGYVWRTLSVELEPFEEDRLEDEEEEAARLAEKAEEAGWFMELMLSHGVQAEEDEEASEPSIVVRGWMPEDVTARAELISYSEEDLYAELALMHTELRFYDGEGRSWTPAVPVSVFVDGDVVRELSTAKMDPTVYIYQEEEPLPEEPEERLFSVEAFSAARTDGQEKTYEIEQEDVHVDVLEQPLMKDDEYPGAVCFETASESLRFAVTARQQERYYSASTEDGKTEIVAVGTLPKGLNAAVAPTSADLDTIKVPGRVLMGWDLSLTHPEEADYHIDGSVKLALHDAALADAQDEIWELQLWQLRENEAPVRVKNAVFRGEDLRFSAEELSTYVVVRVAVERCLTATDGESYSIRVSYDSNAGIPAGAELEVREIRPDDAEYAKYMVQGIECAKEQLPYLDFIKLFDITLRDPETGVTYQPNQNVKVSIELLSDSVAESTEVKVVHFGKKTELMGSSVNEDAVSFETSGFSVYVVMGVTVEKTITAADGNTYEISVTYDRNAGIPAGAELKVRELDGEEYQQYLEKTADFLSRSTEELEYTRLFDITIEKDGVVYEPNKAVSVSVKLTNRPGNRGELRVVHFADEGTELLENEFTEDGTLEFRTNSFSVYAITDESGDVTVPRVWYEFYQYQRNSNGQIITEGGKPKYLLVPDENNGRQIIRTQGKLIKVVEEDFAATSALYFLGWYIWDEDENKWGDKIEFDTPISVMWGAEEHVYGNSVVVPKAYDENGKQINQGVKVTVRARYTTSFATINFYNDTKTGKVIRTTVRVPVPEGQSTAVYEIPDVTNELFTVDPDTSTPDHRSYAFYGWNETRPSRWDDYYTENNYKTRPPRQTKTVTAGYTYDMYPVFCKGHWVVFHTAPIGSGADFVKPEFVLTNGRATKPGDPYWRGYSFRFWSEEPTFDPETGEIFPDNPDIEEYHFNNIVDKNLDLYAVWEAGYSTYNVIVWKQRVDDDRYLANKDKTYEFDSQYTFDAKVWKQEGDEEVTLQSTGLDFTTLDTNPDYKDDFVGFHHKVDDETTADDPNSDTLSARVLANGTTTLNVYYDRDIIKYKFYDVSNPGYTDWHYLQEKDPAYKLADGADADWGCINGRFVKLRRGDPTTKTIWTVNGKRLPELETEKKNSGYYDGQFYTVSSGQYTATEFTFENPPTVFSKTYYVRYLRYQNSYWGGSWQSEYQKASTTNVNTYLWYTLDEELYEGARYKYAQRSDWFWYVGLYGQNMSKYGYSWPTNKLWTVYGKQERGGNWTLTYMGQFVLDPDCITYEENDCRLFSNGSPNSKIYFYLQKEDGSYALDSSLADGVGVSNGNRFTFSEKYDGFSVASYCLVKSSSTTLPQNGWKTATVGQQASINSGYTLHVRYSRKFFSLSYFDGMDGQPLTVLNQMDHTLQVEQDLRFGETLEKYYPEMDLDKFQVVPKESGWLYEGRWYADWNPCTTQVFFRSRINEEGREVPVEDDEKKLWYYYMNSDESKEHIYVGHIPTEEEQTANTDRTYGKDAYVLYTTMPNRNLAIYAGFTRPWYWIKIDPNGGELNWLTGDGERNYSQSTYFWEQYGAEIEEYTVTRDFVKDKNYGTYYYHYDEFNSDEPEGVQPATRRAYYTDDADDPLLTQAEKRTKYGKTGTGNAYKLLGWFKVDETAQAGQQLKRFDFANETVTGNLILRAMWRQEGDIYVYYSMDHAVNTNGATANNLTLHGEPLQDVDSDGNYIKYQDNSSVMVPVGSGDNQTTVYATDDDGNRYDLVGWFYHGQVTPAGGIFTADPYDVDQHPVIDASNPRRPFDTVILYPVFRTGSDESTGGNETALILDANGGRRNEAYDQLDPSIAAYTSDGTQVRYTKKLLLNMDVDLPISLPDNDVFVKDKAELLGWATNKDAKQPNFTAGQLVGVDNNDGSGFDGVKSNILYAVWHVSELTVKVRLREKVTLDPIPGGEFTLDSVTGNLVSNDAGWLAQGDTVVFNLKTPEKPNDDPITYKLTEVNTAAGYIPLPSPVDITIDYYGNFDVEYETQEDVDEGSLNVQNPNVGEYTITILERPAICKVAKNGTEKLFDSLNAAVEYIEAQDDKTGTIEMIRDYMLPYSDIVGVDEGVNVTLTTAKKGVKYPYLGDGDTATITRKENSPSLFTVMGSFSVNNIVLDGANDKFSGKTDGGLICVNDGGKLSVSTDATLKNSTDDTKGGAIYLAPGAEATVTACTITGNKAAEGAGIYVSGAAKLSISGNINFGGSGIEGTALSTTAGNFSTTAISGAKPTNAGMAYPYGRQDIYLAEDGDEPTTLFVTDALTGGDGTIWVWAASESHYGMNNDFAVASSPALLTDDTMHVFRNAREDNVTACGTKYLTGEEGSKTYWIAWTGGVNVNFKKTDGYGEKLAGAKFALFNDLECTNPIAVDNVPVTAISSEDGVVTFEMVSSGIYYMQETVAPGNFDNNPNTYVLLVGKEYMTIPAEGGKTSADWTRALAGSLSGIKQEEIDAQRAAYNEVFNDAQTYGETYKREQTFYVIFQLDIVNHTHYVTTPDIARVGIVNVCTITRPVILSKINPLLQPLMGGKFTLRRIDGVEVKNDWSSEDWNSDESGVFFAGMLPLGTYLLEETQAPTNPRNADETFSVPRHYYVFQVTENGIMGFKKNAEGEDVFALTNTITEATSEKYEINKETPEP